MTFSHDVPHINSNNHSMVDFYCLTCNSCLTDDQSPMLVLEQADISSNTYLFDLLERIIDFSSLYSCRGYLEISKLERNCILSDNIKKWKSWEHWIFLTCQPTPSNSNLCCPLWEGIETKAKICKCQCKRFKLWTKREKAASHLFFVRP